MCIEYALSEGGGAGAESSKRESVSGRLLQTANTNAACSFDDGRMQLADKLPLSTLSTAEVSEAPLPCAPQGKCVSLTCSPARAASSAAVLRCRLALPSYARALAPMADGGEWCARADTDSWGRGARTGARRRRRISSPGGGQAGRGSGSARLRLCAR